MVTNAKLARWMEKHARNRFQRAVLMRNNARYELRQNPTPENQEAFRYAQWWVGVRKENWLKASAERYFAENPPQKTRIALV